MRETHRERMEQRTAMQHERAAAYLQAASELGFPARGPRNSPQNKTRLALAGKLRARVAHILREQGLV